MWPFVIINQQATSRIVLESFLWRNAKPVHFWHTCRVHVLNYAVIWSIVLETFNYRLIIKHCSPGGEKGTFSFNCEENANLRGMWQRKRPAHSASWRIHTYLYDLCTPTQPASTPNRVFFPLASGSRSVLWWAIVLFLIKRTGGHFSPLYCTPRVQSNDRNNEQLQIIPQPGLIGTGSDERKTAGGFRRWWEEDSGRVQEDVLWVYWQCVNVWLWTNVVCMCALVLMLPFLRWKSMILIQYAERHNDGWWG